MWSTYLPKDDMQIKLFIPLFYIQNNDLMWFPTQFKFSVQFDLK